MVTLRKRVRTAESTAANDEKPINPNTDTDGRREVSGYEQCRDKRIKENMERMQRLGLLDLSLKLKSQNFLSHKKRNQAKPNYSPPLLSSQTPTPRRSSRLQNATPVDYSEKPVKKEKTEGDVKALVGEGLKPEVYTEEHEKLLGSCEETWTLFIDGVGNDGKRIYDPVKGKTCHQCRQKTLGHRTRCSKCDLVQGQFCGDCLYMRYGENVLEANKNPDWICPVCRGICNCSLCRQAKGWPPTGPLYRKISSLGFKSVAHFLIQTRRPQTNSENTCTYPAVSARRPLPFADAGENFEGKDCTNADDTLFEGPKTELEDGENNDEIKGEEDESLNVGNEPSIDAEENSECKGSLNADNNQSQVLETELENGKSTRETRREEDECLTLDSKLGTKDAVVGSDSNADAEENSECKNSSIADITQDKAPKSEIEYGKSNDGVTWKEDESLNMDSKQDVSNVVVQRHPNIDGLMVRATESLSDSIAGRLKQRRRRC